MRVTFISPPLSLGGGTRVMAIHADGLRALGHEVSVVAPRSRTPDWKARLKAFARGRRLAPLARETAHIDGMQSELRLVGHCGPITDADLPDADVVIATWWETAFAVAALSPSKGRKFYFIQGHEIFPHLPAHISAGSYYLPLRKIVVSSSLVDIVRDLYGDSEVALVPNSVDHTQFFSPARGRQPVRTVGLIYNETWLKGVDVALKAIESARRAHPALRVVAFGFQPPGRSLPLPPGTEFHLNPPQDKLREIYSSCDVFITASRSEGFGLPILEAMACRTPVVASRTGCAEQVIEAGVNGHVVDVEDAAALAARLTEVLSLDDPAWRAMSDAAYRKTLAYTWGDAAKLFERALSAPVPAGHS